MITDRELFEQALEALEYRRTGDPDPHIVERDAIAALRERLARPEAEPWKQAIDDELVTLQSTADSFATPRQAIKALIDWHCSVSLDPQVSSSAAELIEQGRKLAQQDAQPVACQFLGTSSLDGFWPASVWKDCPDPDEARKAGYEVRAAPPAPAQDSESQLIAERDHAEEWADRLAEAIAEYLDVDIGEHSNLNNPWQDALDALTTEIQVPDSAVDKTWQRFEEMTKSCQMLPRPPLLRLIRTT